MAERFYNHKQRIILVVLVILFDQAIVRKIGAYPLNTTKSKEEPEFSFRSFNQGPKYKPVPTCDNMTFCVKTPYYPSDYVAEFLAANNDLKYLATLDVPPSISQRLQYPDDGEPLCTSVQETVRPLTALSIKKRWAYIVNSNEYEQLVQVEMCKSENSACNIIDGFADGWTTTCKQSYIYRTLVAIGTGGMMAPELFKIPASCKCFVKLTGDPMVRIGYRLGKGKNKFPTSSINR